MFHAVKRKVSQIIEDSKEKEVTRKTNNNSAGVYMLYVDCFDDDRVIPFYIGQTANFQERYKQHMTEILSLNRLDYSCYKYALLHGLYNGHYRPCKIFSYMINHECVLNDLHMIVIEEIENEKERLKKENEFINELLASFMGFNQMNCVSKYMDFYAGGYSKIVFTDIVNKDIEHMLKNWGYGYNSFNCFLASGYFDEKQKEVILSSNINKDYIDILNRKKSLIEIKDELTEIRLYNGFDCEKEAWGICESDINSFFKKHGLRSEEKKKLIISVLLFDFEKDRKTLFKYFEQYSDRISSNIIDLLNEKYGYILELMREKILNNQKRYSELDIEENNIHEKVFSLLLPKNEYNSHPLKSVYEEYEFPEIEKENNICYINIEYTCFRADYNNEFYPEICKIDYKIIKDNKSYSRNVFVKNDLMNFWKTDKIYYYEKGFHAGPFNAFLVGNVYTHIPVSMEYKNGINEYTLKNVDFEDEIKVFKEIDKLIDNKTKIIYTTSGYKSTIKRYSEIEAIKNLTIIKGLARMCR